MTVHVLSLSSSHAQVYCPAGSASPLPATSGFYTLSATLDTLMGPRGSQRPCLPGHFCQQGVMHKCPTGRFGMFVPAHSDIPVPNNYLMPFSPS